MIKIRFFVLALTFFLLSLNSKVGFAQENKVVNESSNRASSAESETQWLWGEVIGVDNQKNEITVKYLDYETDSEKEIKINVNDKTTYENAKSLNDIKLKDTLSVDYVIAPDGKYAAKNISVEKPEESQGIQKENTEESANTVSGY